MGSPTNSKGPLVSVIALCYNHETFVEAALASVFAQSYPFLELIVVDDSSSDQSRTVIEQILDREENKNGNLVVKKIFLSQNMGNCRAFNQGFALARGKYIIDFSTDDIMLPHKIRQQVDFFEQLPADYGVIFTEASYIDEKGQHVYYHFQDRLRHLNKIPEGHIYAEVLQRYFICAPTMMIKKKVLDALEGYDEQLAYEDYDFWVRSSRMYKYAYLRICTTEVRRSCGSLSSKVGRPGDKQLYSTYLVCKKAMQLNKTKREKAALVKRIQYELRQAVLTGNKREAYLFLQLLCRLKGRFNFYNLLYRLDGFKMLRGVLISYKKSIFNSLNLTV